MASTTAPGALEIVRSLVNTVEPEEETNLLEADGELRAWCTDTGLCPGVDEDGLTRLRGFREALRDLLEAHAEEGEEAERWQLLQPYLSRCSYSLGMADGRLSLVARGSGPDAAIAAVLAIAYDAIREGTWQRLKACRKHSCRWAFYDRSKNGSGAWCSMRVCGNRVKAERRRARQKSR